MCKGALSGNVMSLTLVAGVINTDAVTTVVTHDDLEWPVGGTVFYTLGVGQVLEGIPVVVLSHGKNGHGAVRGNRPSGFICNSMPADNVDEGQTPIGIPPLMIRPTILFVRIIPPLPVSAPPKTVLFPAPEAKAVRGLKNLTILSVGFPSLIWEPVCGKEISFRCHYYRPSVWRIINASTPKAERF